ncbi:MAG: hypothetical protein ACLRPW_06660 [Intestinibacter sp.]
MTKKLFYNGDILTLEDELYAEAVLVEDGKIKALGKKDELMSQNEDAEMIDLQGKTLMPSFIDAHSHFFDMQTASYGYRWKMQLILKI